MANSTIYDYFQEETEDALRSQIDWQMRALGVDDSFFVRVLRNDANRFAAWRASRTVLPPEAQQTLLRLWQTTLHLLSFLGFQEDQLRQLYEQFMPAPKRGEGAPVAPPWTNCTLKSFLELGG